MIHSCNSSVNTLRDHTKREYQQREKKVDLKTHAHNRKTLLIFQVDGGSSMSFMFVTVNEFVVNRNGEENNIFIVERDNS